MKRSNIFGIILALLAVALIISLVSWIVIGKTPTILQGETDATSYKASSKLAGRIDRLFVDEGQTVKRGDLLYILSTPEVDAKVQQARAVESAASAQQQKANAGARSEEIQAARSIYQQAMAGLDLAEKTYRRAENLYNEGVIAAQRYDEAKAQYDAAQGTANAAKAQYDLALDGARPEDKASAAALVAQSAAAVSEAESYASDSHIYSPSDGEISSIIAREGELVGTGFPVVTLLDMEDIWVTFNIKETLMPKIKKGMKFIAHFPALDRDIELYVDFIAVQADFATWSATRTQGGFDVRTFSVRARPVERVPDLRPGMSALLNWDKL